MDFVSVSKKRNKSGIVEISPKYKVATIKDLMARGNDFYAIWNEDKHMWSTDIYEAQRLIDALLYEHKPKDDATVIYNTLEDFSTGKWEEFKRYLKSLPNSYKLMDSKVAFINTPLKREDYVSRRLPYVLDEGSIDAYDEIMTMLYDPIERAKIEWAIGSIIDGDSKKIQKFIVLYGAPGTGKSTILNIIQKLLVGYDTAFEAKDITSRNNTFASEVFKTNPLIAIQHDGDLSKIEDYSVLNSIISHEPMIINEKFKAKYTAKVNCLLFMGTNKPVKMADANVGLMRRLLDVKPTNKKIPITKYKKLYDQVDFELGAIAAHCLATYRKMGINYYNDYVPEDMITKTDMFYNFVEENYLIFKRENGTTLKTAFEMYKVYCDESELKYTLDRNQFREELKNYFTDYYNDRQIDGKHLRKVYIGFKADRFAKLYWDDADNSNDITNITNITNVTDTVPPSPVKEPQFVMVIDETVSCLETCYNSCPAQYASSNEVPILAWDNVKTKLSDIDTSKLHYVRPPDNHIIIDFDLKDENGNKSLERNIEAASMWQPTYAELSKGGNGIHLHYIYDGDKSMLSSIYDNNIEVLTFTGKMSLRRKLTKCNNIPISIIPPGILQLKGDKGVLNTNTLKNENHIRSLIKKNLNKEIHPGTKSSIDLIAKILEDAYASVMNYDVTDLRPRILTFGNNSTNQALTCLKIINNMQFHSETHEHDPSIEEYKTDEMVFFDVEVFPNLFVVVWKVKDRDPVIMINPKPTDIENLIQMKLVGFNCRRYDNHILYARLIGYTNYQLYELSQKIINNSRNGLFGEAYNISYTDVYDFASAGNKKSLKKFEIELGIHHKELGLPWDEPVAEDLWVQVGEYCVNDVVATEAVFDALHADYTARLILAKLSGLTPNDTTNMHSTKIMFGSNKHPQDVFIYTDLSKEFPGYKYNFGKSTYKGVDTGEGGYVYSEPGTYGNVAVLDIASMHPTTVEELNLFGPYTKVFSDIKNARIAIKHKEYDVASKMLDGKLAEFLTDKDTIGGLSDALKTVINSIYGLTSAKFENPFRDPRNIDNIVAKRGALFMINLKEEVQNQGFVVAHIKTDSIKIPDATPEIIQFVMDYGQKYGYTFEHEATYDKMCLVNDAVFIAKYLWAEKTKLIGTWSATGTQFQQPYVFKTLFTKEAIEFRDMCEAKAVNTALYLDMNESLPDVSKYEKERDSIWKKILSSDILPDSQVVEMEERVIALDIQIAMGHDYHFIGKVGAFCPIKPDCGGGVLLREKDGKYYAASGSKGYRWLESEMVELLGKQLDVDQSYYAAMCDKAIDAISKYCDFEWFRSEDKYFIGNLPVASNILNGNTAEWDEKLDAYSEEEPF
jgi:energy-coupling factor transporter ATP-binding protein EcfA2